MNKNKIVYKKLSYEIVGILFEVYNELGYGYQERHYEKAIKSHFQEKKIKYIRQAPYQISVKGKIIGRYYFDFLVEDKIILEIKKGKYFSKRNLEQVKGYLHHSKKKLAILANFTPDDVKFKRILNIN